MNISSSKSKPNLYKINFYLRLKRLSWTMVYYIFFRFSPIPFFKWRLFLLNLFGANVHKNARVYPSVKVWLPSNLIMYSGATMGPNVNCYNCALVEIGKNSTISQGTVLCTGTHQPNLKDIKLSPVMPLKVASIKIGDYVWLAMNVFVHPGVSVDNSSIVGACSVVTKSLSSNAIFSGFPAEYICSRDQIDQKN